MIDLCFSALSGRDFTVTDVPEGFPAERTASLHEGRDHRSNQRQYCAVSFQLSSCRLTLQERGSSLSGFHGFTSAWIGGAGYLQSLQIKPMLLTDGSGGKFDTKVFWLTDHDHAG